MKDRKRGCEIEMAMSEAAAAAAIKRGSIANLVIVLMRGHQSYGQMVAQQMAATSSLLCLFEP